MTCASSRGAFWVISRLVEKMYCRKYHLCHSPLHILPVVKIILWPCHMVLGGKGRHYLSSGVTKEKVSVKGRVKLMSTVAYSCAKLILTQVKGIRWLLQSNSVTPLARMKIVQMPQHFVPWWGEISCNHIV